MLLSFVSRRFRTPKTFTRTITSLSEHQYDSLADSSLESLLDCIEAEHISSSSTEFEVALSQGVLKLECGSKCWVINKQTPNKQLWWSSPISGPLRFEFENDNFIQTDSHHYTTAEKYALLRSWRCTRGGLNLFDRLQKELLDHYHINIEHHTSS